ALGQFQWSLLALYPAGLPFVVAVHLCNQLRDFDEDRAFGIRNFPQVLGKDRAVRLCFALMLLAPIPLLLRAAARGGPVAATLLGVSGVLHWGLVVPCVLDYRTQPGAHIFRAMFRRVQLTGPLLLATWLLG